MLDSLSELRKAYYSRLKSAVVVNGRVIPVLDSAAVPNDTDAPYILLSTQTATEIGQGDKGNFGNEATFEVQVVTEFPNGTGGKELAGEIANEVKILIRTRNSGFMVLPNWTLLTTQLESDIPLEEPNNTTMIFRRILRFRHEMYQKNEN